MGLLLYLIIGGVIGWFAEIILDEIARTLIHLGDESQGLELFVLNFCQYYCEKTEKYGILYVREKT